MKALVLAGGTGTRLRPFTHSIAKQLMPVAGRPVLLHCLENIRRIGVEHVGIVVGDRADQIRSVVGDGSALGLRVTYLHQDRPRGLAHCVTLAEDFLGGDDFVMYLGDNVLSDGIGEALRRFRERRPAAQLLLAKVADPRAYGVAEVEADGAVRALAEKPAVPASDLAVIGVYFFTSQIHRVTGTLRPSARGELEISDAVQALVDAGLPVQGHEYTGLWKDTGSPEDLLECNRALLERVTPAVRGEVGADSSVRGPVVLEPGAVVTGSRITGPVVIGAGSVVRDSAIGPYATLGEGCLVESSTVADSILLDHVSVRGVPGLRGSLIGRAARVTGASHTRLVLGDDARVELVVT